MALLELVRVLDEDPRVGAVGGDVRILNPLDSWVSFLSSLRYWVAFNVERACQSYFHCVSCISGPLGEWKQCGGLVGGEQRRKGGRGKAKLRTKGWGLDFRQHDIGVSG